MLARRCLPDGYELRGTVRLRGNRKLWLLITLLSIPWALASMAVLGWLARLVRPQGWTFSGTPSLMVLVAIILTVVVTIVLHEVVHGILLWTFTGTRPVFGYKIWYAYADSPGWYFQRWPMIAVLASPLIVLPAIGLPLIALAPPGLSLLVLIGLTINAVSAIGDVYMVGVALRIRGPVYFGDTPDANPGESGSWYLPGV